MVKELCFIGRIGNMGVSFTEKTNSNLLRMYQFIDTLDNTQLYTYRDFQELIEFHCHITKSNIRMYTPLLMKCGLVIPTYSRNMFRAQDYFTQEGKMYCQTLKIIDELPDDNSQARLIAIGMKQDMLKECVPNIISDELYRDFILMCLRYGSINVQEFNLLQYTKYTLNDEKYMDSIADQIKLMRSGDLVYRFTQNRVSKTGARVTEELPDNTFNYTRNFYLEAGIIEKRINNSYCIKPDKIDFIRNALGEEVS